MERMYRSYEEFQREELQKMDRMDVSFEDLLSEFDNDRRRHKKDKKRQGLFDVYEEDNEEDESMDD